MRLYNPIHFLVSRLIYELLGLAWLGSFRWLRKDTIYTLGEALGHCNSIRGFMGSPCTKGDRQLTVLKRTKAETNHSEHPTAPLATHISEGRVSAMGAHNHVGLGVPT